MTITFRPHHFLCTLGFQGKGYSPHFLENYASLVEQLQKDEETLIQVVEGGDAICKACPHLQTTGCEKEKKIRQLDESHLTVLTFSLGQVISWKQAKAQLKTHMSLEVFHQACRECEWKDLGLCETALKKLHKDGQ